MFLHQVQYASNDAAQCVILYSITYIYFNIIQIHKNVEIDVRIETATVTPGKLCEST